MKKSIEKSAELCKFPELRIGLGSVEKIMPHRFRPILTVFRKEKIRGWEVEKNRYGHFRNCVLSSIDVIPYRSDTDVALDVVENVLLPPLSHQQLQLINPKQYAIIGK